MNRDRVAKLYAEIFNLLVGKAVVEEEMKRKREFILRKLREILIKDYDLPLAKDLLIDLLPITVTGEQVLDIIQGRVR